MYLTSRLYRAISEDDAFTRSIVICLLIYFFPIPFAILAIDVVLLMGKAAWLIVRLLFSTVANLKRPTPKPATKPQPLPQPAAPKRALTVVELIESSNERLRLDLSAIAAAKLSAGSESDAGDYVRQQHELRVKGILDGKIRAVISIAVFIGLLLGGAVGAFWNGIRPGNIWKSNPVVIVEHKLPFHRLLCGATRSGKSVFAERLILEAAIENKAGLFIGDPHGPLATKILEELIRLKMEDRIIYDPLSYCVKVPGYEMFSRSLHPDRLTRESHNQVYLDQFVDILTRDRGIDILQTPQIGKYIRLACKVWLCQADPLPLSMLPYALAIKSEPFFRMLENCTDDRAAFELGRLAQYNSIQQIDSLVEPAKRLLDPLFESPPFLTRISVEPFNITEALLQKKIIIQAGGNMVAPTAVRQIIGSTVLNITRKCEEYYGQNNETPLPVKIFLDEASSYKFIGANEGLLLPQCLKWGAEWTVLLQQLNLDPAILSVLLQNFDEQHYFKQGSAESARLAAEQLAISLLDPDTVARVETRERSRVVGYDTIGTESVQHAKDHDGNERKSITKGKTFRPILDTTPEEVKQYRPLEDQIRLFQRDLMTLKVGERMYKTRGFVSSQAKYDEPWKNPFDTFGPPSKQSLQEALCRIRSNPLYQTPNLGNDTKGQQAKGAAARKRSTESETG